LAFALVYPSHDPTLSGALIREFLGIPPRHFHRVETQAQYPYWKVVLEGAKGYREIETCHKA